MAARRKRKTSRSSPKQRQAPPKPQPQGSEMEMPSLLTAALDEALKDEAPQTPHQRAQAQMKARMDQMDANAEAKANEKPDPRLIPRGLRKVLAD